MLAREGRHRVRARIGPTGASIFDVAIERVLGRHPGPHGVRMSGKTDPQIALEILVGSGLAEAEADEHLPEVVRHLESELAALEAEVRARGRVLPGVVDVLTALASEPSVHQSLVTGNLRANAAVKLDAFDLLPLVDLETGAYGSDDADRLRLVPIALGRADRLRGVDVDRARTWVVGDTPRDLACAREGGVRCLLVATGGTSREELAACAPDALLDDLTDTAGVVAILRS
jgi:phosphoglycolate phosphatase-like HAD superfamily hydrolase